MCSPTVTPSKPRLPLPSPLKCIQINLRHSKTASASLAQVMLDLDIDIALVQEPYASGTFPPVVNNAPPGFSSFHQLSELHAYGSCILVRDSVSKTGKLTTKHLSNHVACIDLQTSTGPLRFVSVYLRPSITDFHSTALSILDTSLGNPQLCVWR